MKFTVKDLVKQAIIAALYVTLVLATIPISFMDIQFRIAEVLMILILFDRKFTIGLTIGCFFANFLNPSWMPLDLVIGTIGTLLGCLFMFPFRKNAWLALLFPVLTNAFLVPITLLIYLEIPYWWGLLGVAIGEIVTVYVAGNLIYLSIKNNNGIIELLESESKN